MCYWDLKDINSFYIQQFVYNSNCYGDECKHKDFDKMYTFYHKYKRNNWSKTSFSWETEKAGIQHFTNLIVSMGSIKIKNYFIKNFNAKFVEQNYIAYFDTQQDAEKALEWLKQKIFETTLIGTETIEKEKEEKRIIETRKREAREKKKAIEKAKECMDILEKHIGKKINIPITIGENTLNFKALILNISFDDEKLEYKFLLDSGEFTAPYDAIKVSDAKINAVYYGYRKESILSFHNLLEINFEE